MAESTECDPIRDETATNEGPTERDLYQNKIEKFLKPLEPRWNFIRDVLLWKKPVASLCAFITVNSIFSYFSSGNFRIYLVLSAVMAMALCMGEIRGRASGILERAGITPEERQGYEASLTFNRFCYKLAFIWEIIMIQYTRMKDLKSSSSKKYYGALTALFLATVFAYQYCPMLNILYCTLLFLYLWTPIKYHGTHYVMYGAVEPFFRPFINQWKHSRTKRERSLILKATKGEERTEDSDEEFTKAFHPKVDSKQGPKTTKPTVEQASQPLDTIDGQRISKQTKETPGPSLLESQTPSTVVLEPLLPSTSQHSQAPPSLSLDVEPDLPLDDTLGLELPQDEDSSSVDTDLTSHAGLDVAPSTPEGSSISYGSSASFLPDSQQLPSISQASMSWEFGEDDFSQGLEFPDIDSKEYHSSSESLNADDSKTDNTDAARKRVKKNPAGVIKPSSHPMTSSRQSSSSASTDVSTEFEFLDRSEVEEMDSSRAVNGAGTPGTIGAVTSYVGKWFGYK